MRLNFYIRLNFKFRLSNIVPEISLGGVKMNKIALLSLAAASVLMAGGYKIPETSLNGVALSAANIAHNKSADAAYYNPANMVFMENASYLEVDLTSIGLDPVNYTGTHAGTASYVHNIDAQSESFILPSVHYVSGKAGEARVGLSIVVPGGLSKRWSTQPAKSTAEEFTLQVVEIKPSVAIPLGEKVALGFGFRIVHSSGIVKASGTHPTYGAYSQDMKGDSIDFGYNLALAYKPTSQLDVALTYRSEVKLTEDGSADLSMPLAGVAANNYAAQVTIPLPATASVALAYTLPSKTTVEFVYERNMWSAYKTLDFNYTNAYAEGAFGTAKTKDWKDTDTFRLGITQNLDKMTLMAGAVYDKSPTPDATLGFELPDSNSLSVSLGGRYQMSEAVDIGLSALYSMRESRTVSNTSISGEFTNSNVLIVSAGVGYKF